MTYARGEEYNEVIMKSFLSLFFFLCILFIFSFPRYYPAPGLAYADSNCTNIQKHNKGSVNNNCNNNQNSQNQSQTQENNQNVNVSIAQVLPASTVTVLPHTGSQDLALYSIFGAGIVGVYLRRKAR